MTQNRHAEEAHRLAAAGYRRTSNRYRIVSRIDRPDWLEFMAKKMNRCPADFMIPGQRTISGNWCDHYRRMYSKDSIEGLPDEVFRKIPGSDWNETGYVEVPGTVTGRIANSMPNTQNIPGSLADLLDKAQERGLINLSAEQKRREEVIRCVKMALGYIDEASGEWNEDPLIGSELYAAYTHLRQILLKYESDSEEEK